MADSTELGPCRPCQKGVPSCKAEHTLKDFPLLQPTPWGCSNTPYRLLREQLSQIAELALGLAAQRAAVLVASSWGRSTADQGQTGAPLLESLHPALVEDKSTWVAESVADRRFVVVVGMGKAGTVGRGLRLQVCEAAAYCLTPGLDVTDSWSAETATPRKDILARPSALEPADGTVVAEWVGDGIRLRPAIQYRQLAGTSPAWDDALEGLLACFRGMSASAGEDSQ